MCDLENIFKYKKWKIIKNFEFFFCFDDFGIVFVMKIKLILEEICCERWLENRVLVCKVLYGSREKKGFCLDC